MQLLAQALEQLGSQLRHLLRERIEAVEGNLADGGGLQRHGGAGIAIAVDGIEPGQLAGQVEAGQLLHAAVFIGDLLETSGAHREDAIEGIALGEEHFPFSEWRATADDGVKLVDIFHVQCQWQAQ